MSILKKRNILKLAAIFMLVAMMAGTFAMHGSAAFAARATACGSGNVVEPTGTNADCAVAVTIVNTVDSTLSFTSVSDVTALTPHPGLNTFSFTADVTDVRTNSNTLGWHLLALASGNFATASPTIDSIATPACVPSSVGAPGTNCPLPTGIPTSITTTAASFAHTAVVADDVSGTVHFTVSGSYDIPAGTALNADFGGTITLTIVSAP